MVGPGPRRGTVSTVPPRRTILDEDTHRRECPRDVVGLHAHKGTMWMSNDGVPLKNIGPYHHSISCTSEDSEYFLACSDNPPRMRHPTCCNSTPQRSLYLTYRSFF